MDSIRENLLKLANERKERSKNYQNASLSSIQTASSDSDGIKNTKTTTNTNNSSAAATTESNKLQTIKSADPVPAQINNIKKMVKMRSESVLNGADPAAVKHMKLARSPSVQNIPTAQRRRERVVVTKRTASSASTSRERSVSGTSNASSTMPTKIKVKDKTYQMLNMLGKGGTSVVYQVFSEHHLRCLAIKIVNLSNADNVVCQAYLNEVQLLEKVQGSPYVIRMHDYEIRKRHLYVVMEVGDIDLATFMQRKAHQIDDKFIKYHWQEMLKCVQVIHEKNIVHSDLKPANFLFVGASLKLIDFGIASNIPSNKTSIVKDIQVGTLNYISPEAITGSYTDAMGRQVYKIPLKSDVWSLGCILYAMVYGRTPFQHISNQLAKVSAISSEAHAIEFPKNGKVRDRLLVDVLKKCLVRDVKNRASIDELLRHPYLADTSAATPSPSRQLQLPLTLQQTPEIPPFRLDPAPKMKKENGPQKQQNAGGGAGGLRVIK